MSYYNASVKHNPYAECLVEARADRMDGRGERGERFVGPQEQNIRDHLADQSVTWEKDKYGNYSLFWIQKRFMLKDQSP